MGCVEPCFDDCIELDLACRAGCSIDDFSCLIECDLQLAICRSNCSNITLGICNDGCCTCNSTASVCPEGADFAFISELLCDAFCKVDCLLECTVDCFLDYEACAQIFGPLAPQCLLGLTFCELDCNRTIFDGCNGTQCCSCARNGTIIDNCPVGTDIAFLDNITCALDCTSTCLLECLVNCPIGDLGCALQCPSIVSTSSCNGTECCVCGQVIPTPSALCPGSPFPPFINETVCQGACAALCLFEGDCLANCLRLNLTCHAGCNISGVIDLICQAQCELNFTICQSGCINITEGVCDANGCCECNTDANLCPGANFSFIDDLVCEALCLVDCGLLCTNDCLRDNTSCITGCGPVNITDPAYITCVLGCAIDEIDCEFRCDNGLLGLCHGTQCCDCVFNNTIPAPVPGCPIDTIPFINETVCLVTCGSECAAICEVENPGQIVYCAGYLIDSTCNQTNCCQCINNLPFPSPVALPPLILSPIVLPPLGLPPIFELKEDRRCPTITNYQRLDDLICAIRNLLN